MPLFDIGPPRFRTQEDEARHHGLQGSWEDFLRMVLETHEELFPGVSVDDLVDDSGEAQCFAGVVRYKAKCWKLPVFLINRVLHRQRKKGREQLRNAGLL